jgi:hypothetical protein
MSRAKSYDDRNTVNDERASDKSIPGMSFSLDENLELLKEKTGVMHGVIINREFRSGCDGYIKGALLFSTAC